MTLKCLESEKGKNKLCENGYMYNHDHTVVDMIHWRCQYYFKFKCLACVSTRKKKIVRRLYDHNHVGDAAEVEAAQVLQQICNTAQTTSDAPKVILADCLGEALQSAKAQLQHLKQNISNLQLQECAFPPLPKC